MEPIALRTLRDQHTAISDTTTVAQVKKALLLVSLVLLDTPVRKLERCNLKCLVKLVKLDSTAQDDPLQQGKIFVHLVITVLQQ